MGEISTVMVNQKILMFPIKLILGFLLFTELFIWIGPLDYHISNSFSLGFYLFILNVAFYIGYKRGVRRSVPSTFYLPIKYLNILLLFGFIATFRYLSMVWANHGLSVSLSSLVNGVLDPGEAYFSESDGSFSGSFVDIIMLDPIRWAAIPLGIVSWKRLSNFFRLIVFFTIFLSIACGLGVGVRKGLFDIIVIFFFMIISIRTDFLSNKRFRNRLILGAGFAASLFLFYFVYSIASRKGDDLMLLSYYNGTVRDIYYNLPAWLTYSLTSVSSYLCQGYYALSKAIEIGIQPIVLFGDNWVSMYYCEKFLGYNPLPDTYLALLETTEGIDPRINWHTMYLWLANQYTFIGVPFVIYWVGYSLAVTWKDAVYGNNHIVFPLLCYFLIMSFYMYANNQVFSDSAISFWIWYFLYYYLRNKRVI